MAARLANYFQSISRIVRSGMVLIFFASFFARPCCPALAWHLRQKNFFPGAVAALT
jgi:hypothetical protein